MAERAVDGRERIMDRRSGARRRRSRTTAATVAATLPDAPPDGSYRCLADGGHYSVIDAVRHNWTNVGGRNRERHIRNTVHPDRRHGSALIDADPKCLHGAYMEP